MSHADDWNTEEEPTEWASYSDALGLPYHYVQYRDVKYCWTTKRSANKDNPWVAFQIIHGSGPIKELYFKKRASAKRAAFRWRKAHIRRNEQQRKRNLCPGCEEHVKPKDDYLCRWCRYG